MPLHDLFVPVVLHSTSEYDPSVFAYALGLATQGRCRMNLVIVTVPVRLGSPVGHLVDGMIVADNQRVEAIAARLKDAAHQLAADAGIDLHSRVERHFYPDMVDAVVRAARVHDLTVLAADPSPVGVERGLVEALLFGAGRPLMVVPSGTPWRLRQPVVAWDGSGGAARALNDAMPLLENAGRATVVSFHEAATDPATPAMTDLCAHLEAHGVTAEPRLHRIDGRLTGELLVAEARSLEADLLVMGAYGHSRLRELLVGGVTRDLLASAALPLFLSH